MADRQPALPRWRRMAGYLLVPGAVLLLALLPVAWPNIDEYSPGLSLVVIAGSAAAVCVGMLVFRRRTVADGLLGAAIVLGALAEWWVFCGGYMPSPLLPRLTATAGVFVAVVYFGVLHCCIGRRHSAAPLPRRPSDRVVQIRKRWAILAFVLAAALALTGAFAVLLRRPSFVEYGVIREFQSGDGRFRAAVTAHRSRDFVGVVLHVTDTGPAMPRINLRYADIATVRTLDQARELASTFRWEGHTVVLGDRALYHAGHTPGDVPFWKRGAHADSPADAGNRSKPRTQPDAADDAQGPEE